MRFMPIIPILLLFLSFQWEFFLPFTSIFLNHAIHAHNTKKCQTILILLRNTCYLFLFLGSIGILYFRVSNISNWFFFCHLLLDIWLIPINVYACNNIDEKLVAELRSQLGDEKKGGGSFIQINSFCFGWDVLIVCVFHVCSIFVLRSIYTDLLCIALNTLCDEFFWNVYQCTKFWNLNHEITCPLLFNFKIYITCAILL